MVEAAVAAALAVSAAAASAAVAAAQDKSYENPQADLLGVISALRVISFCEALWKSFILKVPRKSNDFRGTLIVEKVIIVR